MMYRVNLITYLKIIMKFKNLISEIELWNEQEQVITESKR